MYSRILVPVDGSAAAERGLVEAINIAAAMKLMLVLLHVVDDFPLMAAMTSTLNEEEHHKTLLRAGDDLLAKAAAAATQAGVQSERVLLDVKVVPVADAIIEEAAGRQCSLIVMGTHGRRGLSRLTLGSNAELVVRRATVPVTLVRQPDSDG